MLRCTQHDNGNQAITSPCPSERSEESQKKHKEMLRYTQHDKGGAVNKTE